MNISNFFKLLVFALCASQSVGYAMERSREERPRAGRSMPAAYITRANDNDRDTNTVRVRFNNNPPLNDVLYVRNTLGNAVSNRLRIRNRESIGGYSLDSDGHFEVHISAPNLTRRQILTIVEPLLN